MRKVRVAVVGCGNVAEKYVPHLQRSTAVDLVAVCDPLVDRARSFAQAYTIEHTFQDIDQMLSTLDFELLANLTPMPLHAPINRLALEAGRNVWCEKPIATDLAEAQALLSLAQQHSVGCGAEPAIPFLLPFHSWRRLFPQGLLDESLLLMGSLAQAVLDGRGVPGFTRKAAAAFLMWEYTTSRYSPDCLAPHKAWWRWLGQPSRSALSMGKPSPSKPMTIRHCSWIMAMQCTR